jgi:hypothetical protein
MSEDTIAAAAALAAGGGLEPPSVETLRSTVRSGEQFAISPGGQQLPEFFVGWIVVEWGYDVVDADAFRQWLVDNEFTLRQSIPNNAPFRYRGTYAVFTQTEGSLGSFRTLWTFNSMGAMQAMTDEASAGGSQFGALLKQLTDHRTPVPAGRRSQQFLQPMAFSRRPENGPQA